MSLREFFAAQAFDPDGFQIEAARSVAKGRSVVVTAPTGSGKTLIADAAIHVALTEGKRAFYTTPIKALSNQKFGDLVAVHGEDRVGLLTGDNVINGDADIVVMTTEVFRNMIYSDPDRLDSIAIAILDEVHYLQDRARGAVWEEVIIHAPEHIAMVALSATIANPEEFAAWVRERRGPTDLVIEENRPVPLQSLYALNDRVNRSTEVLPMFGPDGTRNRRIARMLEVEGKRSRYRTPRRIDLIEELDERSMLPAIVFVFSRAGCDAAATALTNAGVRFTDIEDRALIRQIVDARTAHLADEDLAVLDHTRFVTTLEAGIAAHHAGMVPAYKETVEDLFARGLLKVVFATETLALGINMPARTVVIEQLSKYVGDGHALLQPGDYTQLTGRAGRRGIDDHGYGVVLHTRYVDFVEASSIAAAGTHPLRSSFRPTYNMTANLVANYTRERAHELIGSSLASFQHKDRDDELQRVIDRRSDELEHEWDRATCDRGSVLDYLALLEAHVDHSGKVVLDPGDVLDVPDGRRAGRYVILRRTHRGGRKAPNHLVMSTRGRVSEVSRRDLGRSYRISGRITLPTPFAPRSRKYSQQVLRALRKVPPADQEPTPRETEIAHPVAECPQAHEHVQWARRALSTQRRIDQLVKEQQRRGTEDLIGMFRSIEDLLTDWGYMEDWSLTASGRRLRSIYSETDLIVAEALEDGLFVDLSAPDLATVLSTLVYEPRSDHASPPIFPSGATAAVWESIETTWERLTRAELEVRLPPTRRPDPGFAVIAHQWTSGALFDEIDPGSMAPGDIVRVARQLLDILRQVRDTAPDLAPAAAEAVKAIDRDIVAAQGAG